MSYNFRDEIGYTLPLKAISSHLGKLAGEIASRKLELLRANAPYYCATHAFEQSILQICGSCYYLVDIALSINSGGEVEGPSDIAERYGVTKQAISKEIRDRLKLFFAINPRLAAAMEKYAEACIKSDDAPAKPHPAPELAPVPVRPYSEVWELEDYLEGYAERIVNAKHWGDARPLEKAVAVKASLTTAADHFCETTDKPGFKKWARYQQTEFIKKMIDRHVYKLIENE